MRKLLQINGKDKYNIFHIEKMLYNFKSLNCEKRFTAV